jgi:toxin YoeB
MEEIQRTPFLGTGKPEPQRFLDSGVWSRRITEEHRLVYKVDAGQVIFLQCRYHY